MRHWHDAAPRYHAPPQPASRAEGAGRVAAAWRLRRVSPDDVERTLRTSLPGTVLSPAELRTWMGFSLPSRRRDWLAGRLAAKRSVLALLEGNTPFCARRWPVPRTTPRPLSSISIVNAPDGRPVVAGLPGVLVSLSHDEGFGVAVAAFADRVAGLGVDVERIGPLPERLVRRVLSAPERRRLDGAGGSGPPPIVLWSLKEAVLKASGRLPGVPMRSVELRWTAWGTAKGRISGDGALEQTFAARWRIEGTRVIAVARLRGTRWPA